MNAHYLSLALSLSAIRCSSRVWKRSNCATLNSIQNGYRKWHTQTHTVSLSLSLSLLSDEAQGHGEGATCYSQVYLKRIQKMTHVSSCYVKRPNKITSTHSCSLSLPPSFSPMPCLLSDEAQGCGGGATTIGLCFVPQRFHVPPLPLV